MRPSFLLDANISPVVARILHRFGIDARAVSATPLESADDVDLLKLAEEEGRLFVTYDLKTVPLFVMTLRSQGKPLPGVVYVNRATIPGSEHSLLAKSLRALADRIASGEVFGGGEIFLSRPE